LALKNSDNTIEFRSTAELHGVKSLWPRLALMVHYSNSMQGAKAGK
jgi:hypothetical protein